MKTRHKATDLLAVEFQRRVAEDPKPCRDLLEILIADQEALDAYRANLGGVPSPEWPGHPGAGPSWPEQDLIDQIVLHGLAEVPAEDLSRLFRDVEALFAIQVEVQLKAALRAGDDDPGPWFWEGRLPSLPVDATVEPTATGPPTSTPTPTTTPPRPIERTEAPKDLILFRPKSQVRTRVDELILAIGADYAGRPLTIVPIMIGGCFFAMDLYRGLAGLGPRFNPVVARSYVGTESGRVRVDLDMLDRIPFAGQHVLIVDDILDTGQTLTEVDRLIRLRGPSSVRTCVLLRKDKRDALGRPSRSHPFFPDYIGFEVHEAFMVGYGLDYEGAYRELGGLYELPPSALKTRGDQGILIRIGGRRDSRLRALALSWLEIHNLGPDPIEDARFTVDFCVRRGWSIHRDDAELHCETVQKFHRDRWDPGDTLRATIDRPDLDKLLDRVHISLESRINGDSRSIMTGMTRDAITQNPRIGPDPGAYYFEQVWPVTAATSEQSLGVG